jgi:hypothetical protein
VLPLAYRIHIIIPDSIPSYRAINPTYAFPQHLFVEHVVFFVVQHFESYNIAGLILVLKTFLLTFVVPSCHIERPYACRHFIRRTLILWLTSLLISLYICSIDPKHIKVCFLGTT